MKLMFDKYQYLVFDTITLIKLLSITKFSLWNIIVPTATISV